MKVTAEASNALARFLVKDAERSAIGASAQGNGIRLELRDRFAMPPTPRWLKRELDKVQLPAPTAHAEVAPRDARARGGRSRPSTWISQRPRTATNAMPTQRSQKTIDAEVMILAAEWESMQPLAPTVADKAGQRPLRFQQSQSTSDKNVADSVRRIRLPKTERSTRERTQVRKTEERGNSARQPVQPHGENEEISARQKKSLKDSLRDNMAKKLTEGGFDLAADLAGDGTPYGSDDSSAQEPSSSSSAIKTRSGKSFVNSLPNQETRKNKRINNLILKRREKTRENLNPADRILGEPNVEELLHYFTRYQQSDKCMSLQMAHDVLNDIGIKPITAEEKRIVARTLQDTVAQGGFFFNAFADMLSELRAELRCARHTDILELFKNGLRTDDISPSTLAERARSAFEARSTRGDVDGEGLFDVSGLRQAVEQLGNTGELSTADMKEVNAVFDGYEVAANTLIAGPTSKSLKRSSAHSRSSTVQQPTAAENVLAVLVHKSDADGTVVGQFDLFEVLLRHAVGRVIVGRRNKEWLIAKEYHIHGLLFEQVRPDLEELLSIFNRLDTEHYKYLEPQQIMDLLISFGSTKKDGMTEQTLAVLMEKVKLMSLEQTKKARLAQQTTKSDSRKKASGCDFLECVLFVQVVRQRETQSRKESLRNIFRHYDADKSGEISMKELSRLLKDIGREPRTRAEQQEIRTLLDTVDKDASWSLSFSELEYLVQRLTEGIERVSRRAEFQLATDIGLTLPRCRELLELFQAFVEQAGRRVLHVPELRNILVRHLGRPKVGPQELQILFDNYGDEQLGGLDAKGFLRLAYAVENPVTQSSDMDMW